MLKKFYVEFILSLIANPKLILNLFTSQIRLDSEQTM